jgi:hypothetical protein
MQDKVTNMLIFIRGETALGRGVYSHRVVRGLMSIIQPHTSRSIVASKILLEAC